MVFAFLMHDAVHSIANTLKPNLTQKTWGKVSFSGFLFAFIVSSLFAISGYFMFTDDVSFKTHTHRHMHTHTNSYGERIGCYFYTIREWERERERGARNFKKKKKTQGNILLNFPTNDIALNVVTIRETREKRKEVETESSVITRKQHQLVIFYLSIPP